MKCAGRWKDRGRRNHGGRAGPRGPARLGTGARAGGACTAAPHRRDGRRQELVTRMQPVRGAALYSWPGLACVVVVQCHSRSVAGGTCGADVPPSPRILSLLFLFFVLLYYIATPIEMLYFIYLFYCRCLYGPHPCTTLFMCPCPERPGTPLARCVCWDVPVVAFLLCLFGQDTVATCRDARSRSRLRNASAILRLCAQITLI